MEQPSMAFFYEIRSADNTVLNKRWRLCLTGCSEDGSTVKTQRK
jgi:hypothetical protein